MSRSKWIRRPSDVLHCRPCIIQWRSHHTPHSIPQRCVTVHTACRYSHRSLLHNPWDSSLSLSLSLCLFLSSSFSITARITHHRISQVQYPWVHPTFSITGSVTLSTTSLSVEVSPVGVLRRHEDVVSIRPEHEELSSISSPTSASRRASVMTTEDVSVTIRDADGKTVLSHTPFLSRVAGEFIRCASQSHSVLLLCVSV